MERPCLCFSRISTTQILRRSHRFPELLCMFAKLNITFANCESHFANCSSSPSEKNSSPTQNSPNCSPSGLHPNFSTSFFLISCRTFQLKTFHFSFFSTALSNHTYPLGRVRIRFFLSSVDPGICTPVFVAKY